MRLVRLGPAGSETPGVLVDDDTFVDLSDVVGDFDEKFFGSGALSTLEGVVADRVASGRTEPVGDRRFGAPFARPHQILGDRPADGLEPADTGSDAGLLSNHKEPDLAGRSDRPRRPAVAVQLAGPALERGDHPAHRLVEQQPDELLQRGQFTRVIPNEIENPQPLTAE